MVASGGSSSARFQGNDRFYSPPALRRLNEQQQQHKLHNQRQQSSAQRPARSKPWSSPPEASPPVELREVAECRAESGDAFSKPWVQSPRLSTGPPPLPPAGNLDRFLEATTPLVLAQYHQKTSVRGLRNGETVVQSQPLFCLGDLWESFNEWSAYGAGVPLVLNGIDSVVQYYVPYLSAIQIFVDTSSPTKRRQPDEESDNRCPDTSSDSSCESEVDQIHERLASLQTTDHNSQGGIAGEDGYAYAQANLPVFEYLERDSPYCREPLADKVSVLASTFPELKTYRSCDLLPLSWMSVAWYPIYRIPTGPTLKDLDACFLTFHTLATPKDGGSPHSAVTGTYSFKNAKKSKHKSIKLPLPVFGLASYKFKGSVWASNGQHELQIANSLLQAADNWLRLLRVDHPDYSFFVSRFCGFR